METASFVTVFSLSFAVALTGAMAPGPLLTYTIVKSAGGSRRGYLTGLWVITGHAVIEAVIILLLLAGFSSLLNNPTAVRIIGVCGGTVLVLFSLSILRDLSGKKVPHQFGPEEQSLSGSAGNTSLFKKAIKNPVAGGALVSMANPYWWIWWATFGLAFMSKFNISFDNPFQLAAFFIGHEAGDLAWYLLISVLSFWGIRRLNRFAYYTILAGCALFMAGFGLYLGVSPFFS